MENNDLPELSPCLDRLVKLEKRKNSLLIIYTFRPYLMWVFLSVTVLFVLLLYFAGVDYSTIGLAIFCCLGLISILQKRVFDKCQIEFCPREIICKRGLFFPKVTTLRRYNNYELKIEFEVERGRTQHGTVEHYSTSISDSYSYFKVYCSTSVISLELVKVMKECAKLTKKAD